MTPLIPIVGTALLGAGAYAWYKRRTKKKDDAPVKEPTAEVRKAAFDLGYSAGCAEGTDSAKAGLPEPLVDGSDDKVKAGADASGSPADYIEGYVQGVATCWAGEKKKKEFVPDVVVPPPPPGTGDGMKKGETPYDYGCRRGTSSGAADGKAGEDSAWAANLETTGSKKRQIESGNPVQYREGYKKCYIGAYATVYAVAKGPLGEMDPGGSVEEEKGWWDSITSGYSPKDDGPDGYVHVGQVYGQMHFRSGPSDSGINMSRVKADIESGQLPADGAKRLALALRQRGHGLDAKQVRGLYWHHAGNMAGTYDHAHAGALRMPFMRGVAQRPVRHIEKAIVPTGPMKKSDCYTWAFTRGRKDRDSGQPFDNEIVAHSDLRKDAPLTKMTAEEIESCALAILDGYRKGYGSKPVGYRYSNAFITSVPARVGNHPLIRHRTAAHR